MRQRHPGKLGDVIDGKLVVAVFWQWTRERGNVPMYRLEGVYENKVFSYE
jgi:hypothetical protein